jgi:DNA-binding MarR family transcriptional regulator
MKASARLAPVLDALYRKLRDLEKTSIGKHLPRGVTLGDVRVLRAVSSVGDAGVSAVAGALGTSQPAATVAIARLESRGLVHRVASAADGRKKQLALTAKGRQVEQAHGTADLEAAEALLAPLGKNEKTQMVELLVKLASE